MKKIFCLLFEPCPPISYGIAWAEDIVDSQVELAQEATSLVLDNLQASKNTYEDLDHNSFLLSPHYTDLDPAECDTANGQHLMQNAPEPLSANMPEDNTVLHWVCPGPQVHCQDPVFQYDYKEDQMTLMASLQDKDSSFTLLPLGPSIDVLSRLSWIYHDSKRYAYLNHRLIMCGNTDYPKSNNVSPQEWDKQPPNGLVSMPACALYSHGASATFSEKNERSVTIDLRLPFDGGGARNDPLIVAQVAAGLKVKNARHPQAPASPGIPRHQQALTSPGTRKPWHPQASASPDIPRHQQALASPGTPFHNLPPAIHSVGTYPVLPTLLEPVATPWQEINLSVP
jgi:hypothetical protein